MNVEFLSFLPAGQAWRGYHVLDPADSPKPKKNDFQTFILRSTAER